MKLDRYDSFVIVGTLTHIALFALGFLFLGWDYTILIFILWGLGWMTYCGLVADKWDEAYGLYDDRVSVQALALVGGPLCWLLCPTCLIPAKQRAGTGISLPWHIMQRIVQQVRKSIVSCMRILHGYCERQFTTDYVPPASNPEED